MMLFALYHIYYLSTFHPSFHSDFFEIGMPPFQVISVLNLAYLWPHEIRAKLHSRLRRSMKQVWTIGWLENGTLSLRVEIASTNPKVASVSGEMAILPARYAVGMQLLMEKWSYFAQLYEALSDCSTVGVSEETKRNFENLYDYWGRTVLYIDRVLEYIIQWSQDENPEEECHVLRLFLAQESNSTIHSTDVTRVYEFTEDYLDLIQDRSTFFHASVPTLYIYIS